MYYFLLMILIKGISSFADVLVCLVTMDAESFGPEALSEVQILEKRMPTAIPSTPKSQPAPMPGYYV